jgi:methyl-accepting chemotaxis protein
MSDDDDRDARILAAIVVAFDRLRDDLGERLEVLDERLVQTRADVMERLVQVRADVMERIDRLRDALTARRDDDAVNFGAAERAEKIAPGAREEVRAMGGQVNAMGDQVNAMVRQIQRLQSEVRQLKGES